MRRSALGAVELSSGREPPLAGWLASAPAVLLAGVAQALSFSPFELWWLQLIALAVLAHEVPHHMGDLMVLRAGASSKRMALVKVSLAGAVTTLGGLVGFWLVAQLEDALPYFLVVASASFMYVALADLIPQLQKRLSAAQTAAQIAWLLVGVGLVTVVSALAHGGH